MDDSDPYAEGLEASVISPDTPLSNQRSSVWDTNGIHRTSSIGGETQGLEALSAVATRDSYPLQPPLSVPIDPTTGQNNVPFNQPDNPPSLTSIASPTHGRSTMPPPVSPSASVSSSNNITFLLNPSMSPPVDPNLQSPPADRRESPFTATSLASQELNSDPRPDINVETGHEVAFLMRHFSEGPGQW